MLLTGRRLQRRLNRAKYFDSIRDTSTGGLIAIMLGLLGMVIVLSSCSSVDLKTIDECIGEYMKLSQEAVDQVAMGVVPVGDEQCRFDYIKLEKTIKTRIQQRLKDENYMMSAPPNDGKVCPTFVLAKSALDIDSTPTIFRAYTGKDVRASKCAI